MMKEAFSKWSKIETDSGQEIFIQTGFLAIGKPGLDGQTAVERVLKRDNIPMEILNNDKLAHRYPMLRFDSNTKGILEEFGGVLLADKAKLALQELFERNGGHFKRNEQVVSVQPGSIVTVNTSKATYKAQKVILTVGPWSREFIRSLGVDIPLQLKRISVCYWRVDNPKEWETSQFPVIIDYSEEHHFYGLPILEYPGLFKLCWHDGPTITSPDQRDEANDKTAVEVVSQYIRDHITGMSDKPTIVEPCIYTCTPDNDFILDHHPEYPNIIIGAGFSGGSLYSRQIDAQMGRQRTDGRQTDRQTAMNHHY
jgi:sarcosine oxidase/L-pipecolate oxidase